MSKCKQCDIKVNAILGRADGLCKECGAQADAQAKIAAEQKELERREQIRIEAKADLDTILKTLSTEEPLCYSFISWGIEEKKKDGLGFWVGGALGGVMGAVIGSAFSPGSCKFSGEMGLLIVKEDKLVISHLKVPFQSAAANINTEHLKIFLAKLNAQEVITKVFNIKQLQFFPIDETGCFSKIVSGTDTISFRKSDLYINEVLLEMASIERIHEVVQTQGSLISPKNVIDLWEKGECAISEDRYLRIKHDRKYLNDIFEIFLSHPNRDLLARQLNILSPSHSAFMCNCLQSSATSYGGAVAGMIIWGALFLFGLWGIFDKTHISLVISIIALVFGLICLLVSNAKMKRAKWCRKIIRG